MVTAYTQGMHVLMISLDSSLMTDAHGNARARHLDYATRCGKLTIIVRTRGGSAAPVQASSALTLIPTASRHPILFPWDAYRIGRALDAVNLIVTQDQFTSGLPGVWLRNRLHKPVLVQNHSTIFGNPAWIAEKPLRNRALLALATYVRARADFVRTVNERERSTAIAAGIPAERVASIPLGTVSAAFAAPPAPANVTMLRAKLGLHQDTPVVLWVGYPVAFKRLPLLLEMFQRLRVLLPNARLLLVGDLSRSPENVQDIVARLGIRDQVIMTGNIAHDELPCYYALGSVYALTSSYEGVPRALMEAASQSLPIVALRAPGVDEAVDDGVTGRLVDDIEAMSGAIAQLLTQPHNTRALGNAGRERALKFYGAENYAERWVGVWHRAAELGMRR
jgi:glycosyltransferase involved in cell wall biosynthesis